MKLFRFRTGPVVFIFIFLILIGTIAYLAPEGTVVHIYDTAVYRLLVPVQSKVSVFTQWVSDKAEQIRHVRHVQERNEELEAMVSDLLIENNQLKEYKYENERLNEMLNFQQDVSDRFTLVPANIIARDPNNWFRVLTVNCGQNEGISLNQVVVVPRGLVGRVVSVSPDTARVLLILDRDGAVGGLIQKTRTPGVLESSQTNPGLLNMIHIPYDAPVTPGERVVTSGLGDFYPKGLPIGTVINVETDPNLLSKQALIRPYVDFHRLEEVFIIKEVHVEAEEADDIEGVEDAEDETAA